VFEWTLLLEHSTHTEPALHWNVISPYCKSAVKFDVNLRSGHNRNASKPLFVISHAKLPVRIPEKIREDNIKMVLSDNLL
jgi:hypothetical protein